MPSISSIAPATFDAGRSVTLSGSGFGASQGSILIAGQAQTVTSWSDTSITFTTVRGSQSLGACRVDVVGAAGTAPLFEDGFESGNLSTTQSGFAWGDSQRTSIVTMNGAANEQVWPTYVNVNDGRDWTAKTGNNSLRFRYPAGEPWAEQRFSLSTPKTDLWFRFWLRIPTNFTHGNSNNKLFSLWQDGYEAAGDGGSAFWNFWPAGGGDSYVTYTYTRGGYTGSISQAGDTSFIDVPSDRGRWMQICFRCKVATTKSSDDGILQMWRRWSGETSWTQFHNITNADMGPPDAGSPGWLNGYVMGWANNGYAELTEFLLDDFTVSERSLL